MSPTAPSPVALPSPPSGAAVAGARRRVVVAMSGGVDSSVVAALLKEAGHDVIGITLQLYDHGTATARKGSCCAGQDIHDARRVAETIGIPHYVLDYEARFASAVMQSFADSYAAGETPIPCVSCNSSIKFGDLLEASRDLGADVLATGHYIRRTDGPHGPELRRAADADRDQSYFLFATTRHQLEHLWFPLGDLRKPEVRALAHRYQLPIADKADSQDICFVPSGRYAAVVEMLKPGALKAGDIVHADGRVLGRHDGIVNYTIGQRRGLKIANGEPLYVLRLDAARNEVVVGPREFLRTTALAIRGINWLGDDAFEATPAQGRPIQARMRSTQAPRAAVLFATGATSARVELEVGEEGLAAGQACVFYDGDGEGARILGGGTIDRADRVLLGTQAKTMEGSHDARA